MLRIIYEVNTIFEDERYFPHCEVFLVSERALSTDKVKVISEIENRSLNPVWKVLSLEDFVKKNGGTVLFLDSSVDPPEVRKLAYLEGSGVIDPPDISDEERERVFSGPIPYDFSVKEVSLGVEVPNRIRFSEVIKPFVVVGFFVFVWIASNLLLDVDSLRREFFAKKRELERIEKKFAKYRDRLYEEFKAGGVEVSPGLDFAASLPFAEVLSTELSGSNFSIRGYVYYFDVPKVKEACREMNWSCNFAYREGIRYEVAISGR